MQTVILPKAVQIYEKFPGCSLIPTMKRIPSGTEVVLGDSAMVTVNEHSERAFPLVNNPGEWVLFKNLDLPNLID